MHRKKLGCCVYGVLLWVGSAAWAGGGIVALQTADPSCPDDSGNVYVDCSNGTVTDNRTGLVWLRDANCIGDVDWHTAMEWVAGLSDKPSTWAATHDCGLSDGSSPGEWRLPSAEEWEAMIADALGPGVPDCTASPPTITNDSGAGCWTDGGRSFTNVQPSYYWSASSLVTSLNIAWSVSLSLGEVDDTVFKSTGSSYVWPVRGGQ